MLETSEHPADVRDRITSGLDQLVELVGLVNEEKGWNEDEDIVDQAAMQVFDLRAKSMLPRHLLITRIALVHAELSEALEAIRNDEPPAHLLDGKPEGWAVELADAVIRIAHIFDREGLPLGRIAYDKVRYNATRPHRHGGKLA